MITVDWFVSVEDVEQGSSGSEFAFAREMPLIESFKLCTARAFRGFRPDI